jgi:hypothetical protein
MVFRFACKQASYTRAGVDWDMGNIRAKSVPSGLVRTAPRSFGAAKKGLA